jgi:hypothetical protein
MGLSKAISRGKRKIFFNLGRYGDPATPDLDHRDAIRPR